MAERTFGHAARNGRRVVCVRKGPPRGRFRVEGPAGSAERWEDDARVGFAGGEVALHRRRNPPLPAGAVSHRLSDVLHAATPSLCGRSQ